MSLFGERKFTSVTGVRVHFQNEGVEPATGTCASCSRTNAGLYPWPLEGFGLWCAPCIVQDSRGKLHPSA